jgi:hypothetical protein
MVAKKTKAGQGGGALGDFAAGVGTFLGKAERKWRDWGPSEQIEKAVIDVRDRAAALLEELNAARSSTGGAAEPPPTRKATRQATRKTAKNRPTKAAKAAAPKRKAARKARR